MPPKWHFWTARRLLWVSVSLHGINVRLKLVTQSRSWNGYKTVIAIKISWNLPQDRHEFGPELVRMNELTDCFENKRFSLN